MASWLALAFLHRNSSTTELSRFFFRIDLFFAAMSCAFLVITILCISKPKKIYLWILLPVFLIGLYALYKAPFEIIPSNFGWSYRFMSDFSVLFVIMQASYIVFFISALILMIRKTSSRVLVKKYSFILFAYIIIYFGGLGGSSLIISRNPNFPPFGGIVSFLQFLFIAYALTLRPEKIIPNSGLKEPINELSQSYIEFLNKLQVTVPGKELGESSFRFIDYIEAMGLEKVVVSKSGAPVFEADKFTEENIREAPDNILRVIKQHPWAADITNDFIPILLRTYKLLQSQSESRRNGWLNQILENHGGFLFKHDMLTELSKDAQLPAVFTELRPGQVYLFKEDSPKKAYGMLKEEESYGIESLCITKLSPETIRESYGIREASILWVTFEKAETTITPRDIAGLTKNVSEFSMKPDGTIILIDCFDQLKFANGFERSLDILKILRALSMENNSILVISIPPMMFEKEELFTIEKELKEGMQQ